ncbi:MAG: hypothetical protein KF752_20850 [Pirellulaceae bacterium]|nr:hypothetical protein [Pirellulaceae bacterium]
MPSSRKHTPTAEQQWQRALLAGITVLLAAVGVAVHFVPSLDAGSVRFIAGTTWKVAVVLGIAWLAAPQLERYGWERLRGTMLAAVVIVIILYSIRPRLGALAAILVVCGSLLVALLGWIRRFVRP